MSSIDDLTLEERAWIYSLVADAFSSVPTDSSTTVMTGVMQALDIAGARDVPLAEVERDYMDLFVVPKARYVAPYESAYRDRWEIPGPDGRPRPVRGLLMGDSAAAIWQAFVEAGVRPSGDLPDHIANELRLVGHLCHVEACADAARAADAARQRERLIAEHLLRWMGELGRKIAENSTSGFYTAAIQAAHALLHTESTSARVNPAGGRVDSPAPAP